MNTLKMTNFPTFALVVAVSALVIALLFLASSVSGLSQSLLSPVPSMAIDRLGEFVSWTSGLTAQASA